MNEGPVGGTSLVRRLAELSNLPVVHIDGGAGSEAFPVSGLGRGWSGAECGRPLKAILANKVANPLVVVDEIDKAGVAVGSSGHSTSMHAALLGLLEPVSAREWHCPYFQVGFDMGNINWLMTANDADRLPSLLRSRLRTIYIEPPNRAQMVMFLERELKRRCLPVDCRDEVLKLLDGTRGASVRFLVKLMNDLQRLETLPLMH